MTRRVKRSFHPGDLVLILLPVPGSALQFKFTGPYAVEKRLTDTDYVISTPDRGRKSRVCHVNMLKACCVCSCYYCTAYCPLEDDLVRMSFMRLNNSAVLSNVDS